MHRVVITGFGALTPLGNTAEESWQQALRGTSGVGPITLFDTSDFPVKLAAEVKNFNPEEHLDRREVRRMDRFEWMALVAAEQAVQHSGLDVSKLTDLRAGVIVSSASGGFISFREQIEIMQREGVRRLSPFAIPKIMSNGAAGLISIKYGLRGPCFSVASACASSSDGVGIAFHLLRSGVADVMIAGGSEAGIHELGIGSFDKVAAYSHRSEGTPSPFSADRDGLIMGEGAAVLILETLEHAQQRGAAIIAEIAGYAASADAYHITAPTEDGSGSGSAIKLALVDARINPDEVDYINAHGTGTDLNDVAETKAIKYALGDLAYRIPISSTKSMTGHMMGATGAVEAMFCAQAIRDGILPPTINYHEPDPECDLDYIPNQAREARIRTAVSNAFGFGGHNSVLVIRAFEG
ncbi:MAG: beta-ketoacyl-ACP synthase II [Anaerolineae bacterium]